MPSEAQDCNACAPRHGKHLLAYEKLGECSPLSFVQIVRAKLSPEKLPERTLLLRIPQQTLNYPNIVTAGSGA